MFSGLEITLFSRRRIYTVITRSELKKTDENEIWLNQVDAILIIYYRLSNEQTLTHLPIIEPLLEFEEKIYYKGCYYKALILTHLFPLSSSS